MSEKEISKLAIGLKIKELRASRGISQKQLADLLDIAPGRLSNWENGVAYPDFKYLVDLALNLKCSFDFLLGIKLDKQYGDLLFYFELLNDAGRKKVIEYAEDLIEINKYKYGVGPDAE